MTPLGIEPTTYQFQSHKIDHCAICYGSFPCFCRYNTLQCMVNIFSTLSAVCKNYNRVWLISSSEHPLPKAVCKDEQRSVIRVLTLVNVSSSEIHMRVCAVYDAQSVITKSTVNLSGTEIHGENKGV